MKESEESRLLIQETTVTDTNSSDLEVEREIQAATNAFGAVLPKLKKYNGTVLPSLLNANECSSRSLQVHYYTDVSKTKT